MPRLLIVNADDLGYTPGVTRGIVRAHHEGIVTSSSVMINMPAAAESVELALREAPDLGLGLHFTLTAGPPVSAPDEIPDLLQDGGLFRRKEDVVAHLAGIDMAQVEHELRAQIDHFAGIAGRPPDHLDSHHHVTYFSPPMLALMTRLAGELGVPIRRPIPRKQETAIRLLVSLGIAPDRAAAGEMVSDLGRFLSDTPVPMPDGFIGAFFGEGATLGDLLNLIIDTPEGMTELMCHPGEVDDDLRAWSGYAERRADELVALTHPSVREMMRAEGIELATFGSLTA
jgi:predicted glycoside hydrolase/deacetylase ChbG (UPF0249 family)